VIWDFQVFSQIWILTDYRPDPSYYTIAIYAYHLSFTNHDYGLGAAISIVTVVMLLAVSVFYIRQMIKIGEVQ
jgi:N,N'-diacetylchitobiose transport system permease protein